MRLGPPVLGWRTPDGAAEGAGGNAVVGAGRPGLKPEAEGLKDSADGGR